MSADQNRRQSVAISDKASLIWNIADILTGVYKPHEYGNVILPMTVIKRFHDTLLPTLDDVWEIDEKFGEYDKKDVLLKKASGFDFYNTSRFTFDTLLSDPNNIADNFKNDYLVGFSDNIRDIMKNFKFDDEIETLVENDLLYAVIDEFNTDKGYLGPDKITSTEMGYIFEELTRRFSESYNEEAGQHFTSRDIIYLMTDLLIANDNTLFDGEVGSKTVYDQAMGTSQMLSAMQERLRELDPNASVTTFGQEINAQTYAIAKADTMIRGGDADNMKLGNTLTDDQFKGYSFDYCISNPPFGRNWSKDKKTIEAEHDRGSEGRFEPGLPTIRDGQMLFTLNGISKLKDNGRMAIVHNGSPLFTGAPESGESNIRGYIIENDWLDAIVQLPNDLFYNTGISTYIWLIDKEKLPERRGKVQLIDASEMYTKRRKSIGNKRVDISEDDRQVIIQAYEDFEDKLYGDIAGKHVESKVFDNDDFRFTRVTVESPLIEDGEIVRNSKGEAKADTSLRDTEDIAFKEDIDEYFEREVKPFNEDAWMERNKDKIGYEIPFTRLFYKYEEPEKTEVIASRIVELEESIIASFEKLTGKDVDTND